MILIKSLALLQADRWGGMNHEDLCSHLSARGVSAAALARMEVKPLPAAVVCCAPVVLVNPGQPQEHKMSRGSCGRSIVQWGALSWLLFHCRPLLCDGEDYLLFIAVIQH